MIISQIWGENGYIGGGGLILSSVYVPVNTSLPLMKCNKVQGKDYQLYLPPKYISPFSIRSIILWYITNICLKKMCSHNLFRFRTRYKMLTCYVIINIINYKYLKCTLHSKPTIHNTISPLRMAKHRA